MKKSNDILIALPFCVCWYQQTIRNVNTSDRKSSFWEPNVVWSIWLWRCWTQNLTIWFNPFLWRFSKFVKRKHVILLFRLLTGSSDLIRYLKQGYTVFLSRHQFSYPTCIGKTNKRNLVVSAMQLAVTLTIIISCMTLD